MLNIIRNYLPFIGYSYTGESIDCPLCGSDKSDVLASTDRRWKPLMSRVCLDCGLIRTDPMPTDNELVEYYRSEYRLDYQGAGSRPPKFHLIRSRRDAEERLERLRGLLSSDSRILDFGCGSGEFVALAKSEGFDAVGFEPGSDYASYSKDVLGIDVQHCIWQEADYPKGHFDLITINHVLEHLRDPVGALNKIASWLKPDGVLFIAVPDMRPNSKPSFERFHFAHIYGFTPASLQAAAAAAGFTPLRNCALETTNEEFRLANADEALVPLKDPARARLLTEGYDDSSIAAFVFGGGWTADMGRRFRKWRRDTRS